MLEDAWQNIRLPAADYLSDTAARCQVVGRLFVRRHFVLTDRRQIIQRYL